MNLKGIIKLYPLLVLPLEVFFPSASNCQFIPSRYQYPVPITICREDNNSRHEETGLPDYSDGEDKSKTDEHGINDENKGLEFTRFSGEVIDTIIVLGNERTRRRAIIQEMASKRGAGLDLDLIERDSSYLRGLGFFSSVDISVESISEAECRVIVRVIERPDLFMKYPYPILDYDFTEGIRYGIGWKIKNFRGLGEILSVDFKKRRDKEHSGGASWYVPWVYGKRMRLNLGFFNYRRLDEPENNDFIKERDGIIASFGLPLSRDLVHQIWVAPLFSMEERRSRLSIPGNSTCPTGVYFRQNFLTLGLTVTYDSRNTWVAPTNGVYARFNLKHVFSIRGMEQKYSFCSFSGSHYTSFSNLGTLILAVSANNYEGSLPWFYKMGLGGGSDLRGYRSDFKGTSKILGTVQWRKMVYGPSMFDIPIVGKCDLRINLVAFVDTGALKDGFEYFNRSIFYSTIGGGIEVLSPIQDIVRFEIASDRHGYNKFYLTSGSRF
ncbi:BamA/TamA family outer membrane protein [bacterium]|nr:BamA/TamA family outer membrane protein [bacterium]